ncbi:MAG: hypothetical protein R2911_25645 [Caldilineaceae bacterium]
MKRIFILASVVAVVLVLSFAVVALANGNGPGYGAGPGYGECPAGAFVDADGDGVCDNAPQAGVAAQNGGRNMMQQGRGSFGRLSSGMGPNGAGVRGMGGHGDGACGNFVDEDGDGINDNAPRAGTGNQFGPQGPWRVQTQ